METRNTDTYTEWATAWSRISNPVVVYSNDEQFLSRMRTRRATLPTSYRLLDDLQSMWSFQLHDETQRIYDDPDYPTWYPNTAEANYTCAMHAKYELLNDTIERNLQNSRNRQYIAWLDVGYFRDVSQETLPFRYRHT